MNEKMVERLDCQCEAQRRGVPVERSDTYTKPIGLETMPLLIRIPSFSDNLMLQADTNIGLAMAPVLVPARPASKLSLSHDQAESQSIIFFFSV